MKFNPQNLTLKLALSGKNTIYGWSLLFIALHFVSCSSLAQNTNLSLQEFEKGIQQENVQVLDVRTMEEYNTGYLPNAFLADWTNRQEFIERVKSLDKSKPVYTYCLSGIRSADAANWLNQNSFTAYNLAGGIIAWKNASKPLENKSESKQITMLEYLASLPADKTVLVDFSAAWCPPCKKMEPVLEELQKNEGDRFTLIKIDGAAQTNLCHELNIESFPTFIIYKAGKQVWRKQGLTTLSELQKAILF